MQAPSRPALVPAAGWDPVRSDEGGQQYRVGNGVRRCLPWWGGAGGPFGGFWEAEVGVNVQGVLPVLACLPNLPGVAGLGEAGVCAGLLVPVTGLLNGPVDPFGRVR